MPVQATRVHKQRARELDGMLGLGRVVLVDGRREQRVHPPIETQHALHLAPVGKGGLLDLHDQIEHRYPAAIRLDRVRARWEPSAALP